MTYTKPEIHMIGDASSIIRDLTKSQANVIEFADPTSPWGLSPAYDGDE